MKLYNSFSLCALASIMFIAAPAFSGPGGHDDELDPPYADVKSYRGTGCQARPVDAVTYEFGGICNPSSSSTEVEVNCPIVRDNVQNDDGALIVVNLGVGATPVECTAYSWGSSWSVIDEVTTLSSGGGFVSIVFQLEDSVPNGSYSFTCKLPAGDMSCILSYQVWEWEETLDNMTDYNR